MGGSPGLEDVTASVGDSEGPGTCALYLAAGLAAGVLCRGTEEWSILARVNWASGYASGGRVERAGAADNFILGWLCIAGL